MVLIPCNAFSRLQIVLSRRRAQPKSNHERKKENLRSAAIGTTFTAGLALFPSICASCVCASTTATLSMVFGLGVFHVNVVAVFVVVIAASQTLELEANIDFFTSQDVVDDFTITLVS